MMLNPYKIVSFGSVMFGVAYKDHPYIGIPESWGSMAHAREYMANLLGLTYDEYRRAVNGADQTRVS